jgi:hypothetical protein
MTRSDGDDLTEQSLSERGSTLGRWHNYVLGKGTAAPELVVAAAGATESTAFILGLGFDPRMLVGLRSVARAVAGRLHVVAIGLPGSGSGGPSHARATQNREELAAEVQAIGADFSTVQLPRASDRRRAGLRLAQQLAGTVAADHVVVDISARPKSVYFPLVAAWLKVGDSLESQAARELQVLVTENPELDSVIVGEGTVSPGPLGGFQHGLNVESVSPGQRIWAPVLGAGVGAQLEAIQDRLQPVEIAPVLPFPARNPRTADNLLLEYRDMLMGALAVEPSSYIYADEGNSFDLYRALRRLDSRLSEALAPLGATTLVLSSHASKALSIGVLLAAYENRLPVISAGPAQHRPQGDLDLDAYAHRDVLTCLWLHGEPYVG